MPEQLEPFEEPMVEVQGNSYPVREELRKLGGRPVQRCGRWVWLVPESQAGEAKRLMRHASDGYRSPFSPARRD